MIKSCVIGLSKVGIIHCKSLLKLKETSLNYIFDKNYNLSRKLAKKFKCNTSRDFNNILRKKDLENYNKSGKIFVNKIGKLKQTIFSIFDLFVLIFSKSNIHLTDDEHMEIGKEINLNERF